MRSHLPNLLTLFNLVAGMVSIYALTLGGSLEAALWFFAVSLVFDFLDGLAARALGVSNPLGEQLDSLADMVSFGVAPALALFVMMEEAGNLYNPLFEGSAFLAFLMVPATAWRLARFNLQSGAEHFSGLPSPANAMLIYSLPAIYLTAPSSLVDDFLLNPVLLVLLAIISALLLVAPIPLFSLKFKNFRYRSNRLRYHFLLLSAVLIGLMYFAAVPIVIFLYLFISILFFKPRKP